MFTSNVPELQQAGPMKTTIGIGDPASGLRSNLLVPLALRITGKAGLAEPVFMGECSPKLVFLLSLCRNVFYVAKFYTTKRQEMEATSERLLQQPTKELPRKGLYNDWFFEPDSLGYRLLLLSDLQFQLGKQ